MPYTPTTWVDGTTAANAARLNNIETGISNAALASDAVALATTTPLADTITGTAGTGITASRGDHAHPISPDKPAAVWIPSGTPFAVNSSSGTASTAINRGSFGPLWMSIPSGGPLTCSTVGIEVTTGATAGGTIRFAMWKAAADGSFDFGTDKLFESGEISSTTTGLKTFAYTTPIPHGLYWFGTIMHTAACTVRTSNHGMLNWAPGAGFTGNALMYQDGLTGAFASSGVPNTNGDYAPYPIFTVA
jgi:hypothetical protein